MRDDFGVGVFDLGDPGADCLAEVGREPGADGGLSVVASVSFVGCGGSGVGSFGGSG